MFPPTSIGPAFRPDSGTRSRAIASRAHRAFTLVEMLVVVALIGILAAVVGFSIKGGSSGLSLGTAQRGLMSMIRAAQAAAQVHRTRARMIVFSDVQNWVQGDTPAAQAVNSKILHFYGVVTAMSDDPNLPVDPVTNTKPYHTWVAFNDGAMLPDGIYFVPSKPSGFCIDLPPFAITKNAITTDYTYSDPTVMDNHAGTVTGLMQLYFPLEGPVEEGQGDWWYFVEFAPDRFYFNSNKNDNIILGAGTPISAYSISFRGSGENPNRMFTGAQLRMIGGAAPVRGPDDFESSNTP
ncbi:MAG TPA: type II secretion system protein [Verrucomicrobiae bacterium]|nr:type II secretion system protein [Verrucomicrobiae bacterium]